MKKHVFIVLLAMFNTFAWAQQSVFVGQTNGVTDAFPMSTTEHTFSADGMTMTLNGQYEYPLADINEITFGDSPATVSITYDGDKATVINPFRYDGVSVSVDGANVTVNNANTTTELSFELTGSTTSGSFVYNGEYKTTIVLNGVSITNPKGAAIDIECGKRIAMELAKGTVNNLVDGAKGKQKAALYCKGHLEIDKKGTLNVTGNLKHAISAKEYVQLKKSTGVINILGSKSDGIHCGQFFAASGFTLNINNVEGDGVQVEYSGDEDYDEDFDDGDIVIQGGTFNIDVTAPTSAAFKCDSTLTINDAKSAPEITITTSGNGDKGLKAGSNINVKAGKIDITQTGTYAIEDGDYKYVTAISADKNVNITGGTITINNKAEAGRGIVADGTVTIAETATVSDNTVK